MDSFSNQLIAAEPSDSVIREKYEASKRALIERRLTPLQRVLGAVSLPLMGFLAIAAVLKISGSADPSEWKWLIGLCSLALTALAAFIGFSVWKGVIPRLHDQLFSSLGAIVMLAFCGLFVRFAWISNNPAVQIQVVAVALVLGGGTALAWCWEFWKHRDLQRQAQILELELRLAQKAKKKH